MGDDSFLKLSEGEKISGATRVACIIQACKYMYSQKRSVEVGNADTEGFKITIEDYTVKK